MSVAALDAADRSVPAAAQAFEAHDDLVARAALAGVRLVRSGEGGWVASKYGLVKTLPDIAAVDTWLRRLEGRTA